MTDTNIETGRPIPPGVTDGDLDRALAAIATAIGEDKVAIDAGALVDFQDPFQFPGSSTNVPSGVVSPTSTQDVQAVVRIANEYRVPLWPISRGKNNGYGGAAPQVRGTLMLSFRNMNKVLEINEELGYAVVEPGVSWFDLHDAIYVPAPVRWTTTQIGRSTGEDSDLRPPSCSCSPTTALSRRWATG
jgi:4-cresol dehydrogenase (hydroxylating) flavoprotein subunit